MATFASYDGGGRMIYLDRHTIDCGVGCAVRGFQLQGTGDNQLQYIYQCMCDGANISPAVSPVAGATSFNTGDENTAWQSFYLDRHEVICPDGTALAFFKLERDSSGSNVRYRYACRHVRNLGICRGFATMAAEDGGGITRYLDRHRPHCTNQVMRSFVLKRLGNQVQYLYTCCTMDAAYGRSHYRLAHLTEVTGHLVFILQSRLHCWFDSPVAQCMMSLASIDTHTAHVLTLLVLRPDISCITSTHVNIMSTA